MDNTDKSTKAERPEPTSETPTPTASPEATEAIPTPVPAAADATPATVPPDGATDPSATLAAPARIRRAEAVGADLADRPRVRESARRFRRGTPGWDYTNVHVALRDKVRFERVRFRLSGPGRIVPQWEAFEFLVDAGLRELGRRGRRVRGASRGSGRGDPPRGSL